MGPGEQGERRATPGLGPATTLCPRQNHDLGGGTPYSRTVCSKLPPCLPFQFLCCDYTCKPAHVMAGMPYKLWNKVTEMVCKTPC